MESYFSRENQPDLNLRPIICEPPLINIPSSDITAPTGLSARYRHEDVFFTTPKRAPATGDKEDQSRQNGWFSALLADFGRNRAGYACPDLNSNEDALYAGYILSIVKYCFGHTPYFTVVAINPSFAFKW